LKRYYIIDALRSVLALCVAIGHAGVFPLFGPVGQQNAYLDFLAKGFRTIVFGPPAVIAFFVISGFCIHYPFAESKSRCPITQFYARRYIRILIPVIFTVVMLKILFPQVIIVGYDSILWHSTLWSVVCEEIYYAIYPVLNRLGPQFGWTNIVTVAFATSIPVSWYFFAGQEWQDIGIIATAITLFPVWLMGCYLAENVSSLNKTYSALQIWQWRVVAWGVMWLALVLHFHLGIYQTQTGLWVGIVYYFWLRAEISYYRTRLPWNLLIWAGRWSYSLYLIHPIAVGLCVRYNILAQQSRVDWIIVIAAILTASYAFYLVVERPSHNLARKIPLLKRNQAGLPATIARAP
jgi:peptidoglycan/LPS O-acetylase OafA/YrhL